MDKADQWFQIKDDTVIIPTFKARIDRSKAPRGYKEFDQKLWLDERVNNEISPYFKARKSRSINNRSMAQGVECSLMDHEVKEYLYKVPGRRRITTRTNNQKHGIANQPMLGFLKPHLFSSMVANGLTIIRDPLLTERIKLDMKNYRVVYNTNALKQQLDRNVLRSTRLAMNMSCKQYPGLTSRKMLFEKYGHLFGL